MVTRLLWLKGCWAFLAVDGGFSSNSSMNRKGTLHFIFYPQWSNQSKPFSQETGKTVQNLLTTVPSDISRAYGQRNVVLHETGLKCWLLLATHYAEGQHQPLHTYFSGIWELRIETHQVAHFSPVTVYYLGLCYDLVSTSETTQSAPVWTRLKVYSLGMQTRPQFSHQSKSSWRAKQD